MQHKNIFSLYKITTIGSAKKSFLKNYSLFSQKKIKFSTELPQLRDKRRQHLGIR